MTSQRLGSLICECSLENETMEWRALILQDERRWKMREDDERKRQKGEKSIKGKNLIKLVCQGYRSWEMFSLICEE